MICRKAGQPKCETRFVVTMTGREHRCQRPATMIVDGKRYCGPCGAKVVADGRTAHEQHGRLG